MGRIVISIFWGVGGSGVFLSTTSVKGSDIYISGFWVGGGGESSGLFLFTTLVKGSDAYIFQGFGLGGGGKSLGGWKNVIKDIVQGSYEDSFFKCVAFH